MVTVRRSFALAFVLATLDAHAQSYSAVPRWGQASAIIYDTLYIQGGKTDPSHQYTYTSAPNSNDLLTLDLSSPFSLSTPPWSYVSGSQNTSTSQGPAVAFHTLTPYTSFDMLLFGGDAGFATIGTNADSAWLLSVKDRSNPAWTSESPGWASEPIRRVYHAAPSASGAVYILGGQKGDDSQIGFLESYLFNAVGSDGSPIFITIPDSTNPPPGLFGHAAHVLPGGMLLVFGGFFSSSNTPSLFTTIYILDTTSSSPSWIVQNATAGTAPSPRRGFASVLLDNGMILIHGGADATLQTVYSDGALLDTTKNPMSWSPVSGLSDGLGPRLGHFAVYIQGQVLFGFGWAGNAPASASLVLYDPASGSFASSYTPSTTPVSITSLPASPTAPGGTFPSSGTGTAKGAPGFNPTATTGPSPTSGNGHGSTGNGGTDGNHDPSNQNMTGVVAGSVIGFLAFVALVGSGTYYALRRRERRAWMGMDGNPRKDVEGRWQLMHDNVWDVDETPTQAGEKLQMAGTGWQDQPRRGWGLLGLGVLVGSANSGRGPRGPRRFDMLADEDARQFDVDAEFGEDDEFDARRVSRLRRQEGTGGSSLSFGTIRSRRATWSEIMNASVTSLRNVGAVLGVGAAAVAKQERRGDVSPRYWWEKDELPMDPFSDAAAIAEEAGPTAMGMHAALRPREEHTLNSGILTTYANPFSDGDTANPVKDVRDEAMAGLLDSAHAEDATSTPRDGALAASSQASLPRSTGLIDLARASTRSPDVPASVESHEAHSSRTTNSDPNSYTSTAPTTSYSSQTPSNDYSSSASSPTLPRTTSIIGTSSASTAPMRRSDSWWSRFSRPSFRDRHALQNSAHSTRTGGDLLIDFRDPNPPPRLGPIEESMQSNQSSPETPHEAAPDALQGNKRSRKSGSGYAPSTRSSIKTDNTADSELIERMGGRMEVVQRALSLHSRRAGSPSAVLNSPAVSDDAGRWDLSTVEASGSDISHQKSWTDTIDSRSMTAESPTEDVDLHSTDTFGNPKSRATPSVPPGSITESGAPSPTSPRRPRRTLTGTVAERVSAYEKRMSQDFSQHKARSPPADTSPRQRDKEEDAKRRTGVAYGLVPKAPLFVANPDRRKPS